MDISIVIQSAIYIISKSMLYPVMILLLGLTGWILIESGGFLFECFGRKRNLEKMEKGALDARNFLKEHQLEGATNTLKKCSSTKFVRDFVLEVSDFIFSKEFQNKRLAMAKLEKLLQEYDSKITRKLEKTRLVARIGPMLGLMGTLIPMGPALLGLINGNVQQLANNLIIAFGTTVLGIAVGGIGYMISIVRTRWYTLDMSDMEYIAEILFGEENEIYEETPKISQIPK
ncbi:MAG: MotA/TolQ/ExbB proton channel family protein [Methanosarcinales archaeon]